MLSIILIDIIIIRVVIFSIQLILIKDFEDFKAFNKVVDLLDEFFNKAIDSAKKIFL